MRIELLPRIKEHNNWTLELSPEDLTYRMKAQTISASGQELRVTSVVAMETMMEQIEQMLVIPCFVMTFARPIWQGAVKDCRMV